MVKIMVEQTQTRLTASEYFQLPSSNQPMELLNGVVDMSPAPIPDHQRVSYRSAKYIETLMPNGEVFLAPIDLYLDEANVPQPDVVWVAEDSRCNVTSKRLEGVPKLIVEVYSPGTALKDKTTKFELYQRFGIPEYWMIDPTENYLEAWTLKNGQYERIGVFGPKDQFVSPILGNKSVELKYIFPE